VPLRQILSKFSTSKSTKICHVEIKKNQKYGKGLPFSVAGDTPRS